MKQYQFMIHLYFNGFLIDTSIAWLQDEVSLSPKDPNALCNIPLKLLHTLLIAISYRIPAWAKHVVSEGWSPREQSRLWVYFFSQIPYHDMLVFQVRQYLLLAVISIHPCIHSLVNNDGASLAANFLIGELILKHNFGLDTIFFREWGFYSELLCLLMWILYL